MRRFSRILLSLVLVSLARTATAAETTSVTVQGNLDASSSVTAVPTGSPTFEEFQTAATFETSIDVKDTLDATHSLSVYFFHTGVDTWTVKAVADGGELSGGAAGFAVEVGVSTLSFNAQGDRNSVPSTDFTVTSTWSNGSAAAEIAFLFSPVTQLASASSISSITGDTTAGCAALQECIDDAIVLSRSSCRTSNPSCDRSALIYGVSAVELANRAITAERCTRNGSGSRARCLACYEKAKERLELPGDRALFKGMLARTRGIITSKRNVNCPS